MSTLPDRHPARLRRSVLCVPADNPRALAKVPTLACDGAIYDLEDAVLPEKKAQARSALASHLRETGSGRKADCIVRINSLMSGFGEADLAAIVPCAPDAILIPKVESPQNMLDVADILSEMDAPEAVRLWAMIETPRGVLNVAAIAETGRTRGGRLDCLIPGLNDLCKDTGVAMTAGRTYLIPWLMQILLAGRGSGLDVLDAVFNHIGDAEGFADECAQGRAMGFNGKMLIHPDQIDPANATFGVDAFEHDQALRIIAAFALTENSEKSVIALNGRMVERLHLQQALRLVEKADAISRKARYETGSQP